MTAESDPIPDYPKNDPVPVGDIVEDNGTILGREPVAVAAFIAIAINLAVTFGLGLSVEQIALINALVVAGLSLIVRSKVTPA